MKFKLTFYFFILSFFTFAQSDKCTIKINYNLSEVKENGIISFSATNLSNKNVKVLKSFSDYKAQLLNVFYLEKGSNQIPIQVGTADIDFFGMEKMENLKANQSKTYKVNIFGTFQGSKFLRPEYNYQFDIRFDFIGFVNYKFNCDIVGLEELKNLKYQPQAVQ